MSPTPHRAVRLSAYVLSAALGLIAAGFALQWSWVTDRWMWPDGRLSYIFVGSMVAAMAVGIFWVAFSEEWAAAFAGALNWMVAFTAIAICLATLDEPGVSGLAPYIAAAVILAVSAAGMALWWRRWPVRDDRRVPALVRGSLLVFLVVLFGVSFGLLAKSPHIFPWPLSPQSSLMFGSLFLASAVYFVYGFVRPFWGVAQSQLLAFLAYDLVLIVPFLRHLGDVQDDHRLSLILYLIVIVYSCSLAVYYLFLKRDTRIFG